MKQLIKSATIYNAELPDAEALLEHLEKAVFIDPLSLQAVSVGFVPREDDVALVETFTGGLSFTVRLDQKIIPNSVVNAEVAKRVKQIKLEQGRKAGKKERKDIKSEVIDGFLPRALDKTTITTCYYHPFSKYLIVPTTNKKVLGYAVSALVDAVGSVKTTTINVSNVKGGLTTRLKQWLADEEPAFDGLHPCDEVALEQEARKVSIKMNDLEAARSALNEALAAHFEVKSLGFQFNDGTEARLTDEFKLRRILFQHPPVEGEDELFAAQATLEVSAVVDSVTALCEMFGYKEEEK